MQALPARRTLALIRITRRTRALARDEPAEESRRTLAALAAIVDARGDSSF